MRFSALRNWLDGKPSDHEEEGQDGNEEQTGAGEGEGSEGEGEGQGDDDDDAGEGDQGEGQGGEGEGDDGDDAGESGEASANTAAGRKLVMGERRRWAQVLTHKNAEGREEMAAAMLIEDMSASAIIRVLGNAGAADNPAARRLRQTPRHSLGGNTPRGEGKSGDAAAESRRKALAGVNSRTGRNVKTTSGRERAAGKPSK